MEYLRNPVTTGLQALAQLAAAHRVSGDDLRRKQRWFLGNEQDIHESLDGLGIGKTGTILPESGDF